MPLAVVFLLLKKKRKLKLYFFFSLCNCHVFMTNILGVATKLISKI